MHPTSKSTPPTNRWLKHSLTLAFVLSLVMGTGPGVLLVNRPDTIQGIPLVYAWGILWYFVQVGVVLIAYFCLWSRSSDEENEPPMTPSSTDDEEGVHA
ncbi:hypothetical protein [Neorhodopirellula pilleata]|uniref:DUF3311 domain-containing protein n=1 Tax=Neorhodopirellula pilleata TaxID=2714738 RepID=A0A5C6AZU0_9BACT|nr:hypothetical protein [Neorhodopirellula pilleata]TWU03654.1 hypothetical protein Pla100_05830 [Neorhodopirellula pilleata]